MHTRELVESIAVRRKSREAVPDETFRRLGERIFYVPLQTVRNSNEPGGGKKVRFLTLEKEGSRVVPAFSTEDLLLEWSQGNYQFLPIAGADLVIALPQQLHVELDPGTEHALLLGDADFDGILSQEELPDTQMLAGIPEEVADEGEHSSVPDSFRPSAPEPVQSGMKVPETAEVEQRLTDVLSRFPAVLEAYYLGSEEGVYGGLLGLLVGTSGEGKRWDTEQRFGLIEAIAELARELFGYAGAIEVYDDLDNEASRSWDLFKGQNLFYRKDQSEDLVDAETTDDATSESANGGAASWLNPPGATSKRKSGGIVSVVPGLRLRHNEKK